MTSNEPQETITIHEKKKHKNFSDIYDVILLNIYVLIKNLRQIK